MDKAIGVIIVVLIALFLLDRLIKAIGIGITNLVNFIEHIFSFHLLAIIKIGTLILIACAIIIFLIVWNKKRKARNADRVYREALKKHTTACICPGCNTEIYPSPPECPTCGRPFLLIHNEILGKDVWDLENGQPKLRPQTHENFMAILEREEMRGDKFDEIYKKATNATISPYPFLQILTSRYPDFYLDRLIEYIVYRINQSETKITYQNFNQFLTEFDGEYDQYFVDLCQGGGWIRPYKSIVGLCNNIDWGKKLNMTLEEETEAIIGLSVAQPTMIEPWIYTLYKYQTTIPAIEYDVHYHHVDTGGYNRNFYFADQAKELCCFNIILSEKDDITPNQMEQFWSHLQSLEKPVIFEIVSDGEARQIVFQFICHVKDKSKIALELMTLFPNSINPEGNDPHYLWQPYNGIGAACQFGLGRHYAYPLKAFSNFHDGDPLSPVVNVLSQITETQRACLQYIVIPAGNNWLKHMRDIDRWTGTKTDRENNPGYAIFADCPFEQKLKYALFAVCLRVILLDRVKENMKDDVVNPFYDNIEQSFSSFKYPGSNCISQKPLVSQSGKPFPYSPFLGARLNESELELFMLRHTTRHGFILNGIELAGLCHFPSKTLQHPNLLRKEQGLMKAPEEYTKDGLLIGRNRIQGRETNVYIPYTLRRRHTYVIGSTGMGKTTLLQNMMKQDMEAGNGIGVIDIKGTLIDRILPLVPENRIDDVILFDPTDEEFPIGFNMLQIKSEAEKSQIKEDVVLTIERASGGGWPDQVKHLFSQAIATLLEDVEVHTLWEAERIIFEDLYRYQILNRIRNEPLRHYWEKIYPTVGDATKNAVNRRLSDIFSDSKARNIFSQRYTAFDFRETIDNKKIFLAKLPKGSMPNTYQLFGKILVSKFYLSAISRIDLREDGRTPFYLYVDEFQHFADESFDDILAEAREFNLYLTISHQYISQLPSRIQDSVGQCGSIVVFQIDTSDARALEPKLANITVNDILNLREYTAITRLDRRQNTFSMETFPPPDITTDFTKEIIVSSREKYSRKEYGILNENEQQPARPQPIIKEFE